MPEQLPRNPPPFPLDTIPCEAYNRCLDFESRASDSESMSQLSPLVCARILGYMLIHAPLDTGRVWLSEEIIKCGGDAELKQLGEFYFDHFICVCEYLITACARIVLFTSRTNSQICRTFALLLRIDIRVRGSPGANTEGFTTSSHSQRPGNSKSPSQYATFHHSGRFSYCFLSGPRPR